MAKFVMECPECGRYVEAKTGFFAKKQIDCVCGNVINVRVDKVSSRTCIHCGNTVVFDQSKGEKACCPVCHEKINTQAEQLKIIEFNCAQCGIKLQTSKSEVKYICPICDYENDVQACLISKEIKKMVWPV